MENALQVRIEQEIGRLDWNFEELNKAVDAQLEKYRGLVITEEQLPEAKSLRADLNRVEREIDRRRIEAGKEFCKPYTIFKEQADIVCKKISDVSSAIDIQIKDFENAEKKRKLDRIRAWWDEFCPTSPKIGIEKVFDKKFLNKGCKDSDWQLILEGKHSQITKDLQAISALEPETKRDYCLTSYCESLNLADALGKWEQYSEQLRKAEEFRKAAEQRKAEQEQRKAEQEAKQTTVEMTATPQAPTTANEEILERTMKVWGTREQIIMLGNFMTANNIKFRKVEE